MTKPYFPPVLPKDSAEMNEAQNDLLQEVLSIADPLDLQQWFSRMHDFALCYGEGDEIDDANFRLVSQAVTLVLKSAEHFKIGRSNTA